MGEQPAEWRGVTWAPGPDELEDAIARGLRWRGRRRVYDADQIVTAIAAEEIFAQLRADGFVFLRRPPQVTYPGGDGTGPFARVENLTRGRRYAHCRACGHERELDIASLIAKGWGKTLLSELPLVCGQCRSRDVGLPARRHSDGEKVGTECLRHNGVFRGL